MKRFRCFMVLLAVLGLSLQAFAQDESLEVAQEKIDFVPFANERLTLLSIVALSAEKPEFGGFSALLKRPDGFLSVTDRGQLARFDASFQSVAMMALLEKNDDPLEGKKRTDAEGLAIGRKNTVLVSFERDHRIVPYNAAGYVMGKPLKLPRKVLKLPKNGGLEAIETLQDGRLVLLAEGKKDDRDSLIWVSQKKGGWKKGKISQSDGFRPTGLTRLPGGDQLILLERSYTPLVGVRIRLSMLDSATGQRGALLGELTAELPLDNFEGISAYRNGKGQIILCLISDDNFNPLQRTLVMKLLYKE